MTLALLRPPARTAPVPRPIVQRRPTAPTAPMVIAPPITDAGRPLEGATRGAMESSFGRDLGHVRIHDDARAHDNARALNARAYAAGANIVFGAGAWRPHEVSGQALLAHELAHTVQQAGVQMKSDAPLPAAVDANLEAEADRAALAVTSGRPAPALTRVGSIAVFRAAGDPPAAAGAAAAANGTAAPAPGFPADVTVEREEPKGPGATVVVVSVPLLKLPRVKGKGDWVKTAYDSVAKGGRLVFSPIFDAKTYDKSTSIAAFMEKPGDSYKEMWLNNYGFTSLKGVAKAFNDAAKTDADVKAVIEKPGVKKIITSFAASERLNNAGVDIDHIVEKQIGGSSVANNLQLLVADKNQESGRKTYAAMIAEVKRILEPQHMRVTQLQIRFKAAQTVDDSDADGSFEIEQLLRAKPSKIVGSAKVMEKGAGTPIGLIAGGMPAVVRVRPSGKTPIDMGDRRLIPGMKFLNYVRGAGSTATKGTDTIEAELASKPMIPGAKSLTLTATVAPAAGATPVPEAGGAAASEAAAASENRVLKLDQAKNKDIPFYYPYLSKGKLTTVSLDDQGRFSGTGVITPSVRFLGDLIVNFGPDTLALKGKINVADINKSDFMKVLNSQFRFTSGEISINLNNFKPDGEVTFEVGPKSKPVINGRVRADEEGGAFVATGTLTPAATLPGISAAKGEVSYNSLTGWSGLLTATGSPIKDAVVSAELGFKEQTGAFKAFGKGSLDTNVRGAKLALGVTWAGGSVDYSGSVTVLKPLPLVESVTLSGSYVNGVLTISNKLPVKWKSLDADLTVTYTRKDGDEEGKFSGAAVVKIDKGKKASGVLNIGFNEQGGYWGEGSVSYQVTDTIRPTLGLKFDKAGKIMVTGDVELKDIPLSKKWPSEQGGNIPLIKGVGVKFPIPLPPPVAPAVSAFGEIKGSLGLNYWAGPVMLTGVRFNGSLYPLEEDPQVKAKLTGKLAVPGHADVYGTFGAYIGVQAVGGLVGAKGGIEASPTLGVDGEGGIAVDADYGPDGFSFSAEAYAKGQMSAKLKVDLAAELEAGYGLFTHRWTYNIVDLNKNLGPELNLTLGKLSYDKSGKIVWPSLSQMKLTPENIDPMDIVKDLLGSGKVAAI